MFALLPLSMYCRSMEWPIWFLLLSPLLFQIIGTIPLMPNSGGPSSQSGGGNPALQVQPITPQLLTNTQGQIIATVIGNQILPVINTQGITLSPIKPGQQVTTHMYCIVHTHTHTRVTSHTRHMKIYSYSQKMPIEYIRRPKICVDIAFFCFLVRNKTSQVWCFFSYHVFSSSV